jgi:hypothetical protein
MGASPVVVLLVALGGAREPSTRSMAAAAQEALDPSALVLVREVPDATLASDARAVSLAEAVHADAVAVLTWPDADHHRAHVHVYSARPTRWVDRDIEFRGIDAAEERGKALGYAVAAMVLPRHEAGAREEPEPPPPPPPKREPTPPPPPPSPPPRERRLALDVVGTGSAGIDGDAAGFGTEASARWTFYDPLSLRLGGGLRIGEVPAAQASMALGRFDGGLALRVVTLGHARPLTFGVRADAVLLYQVVSRPGPNSVTSSGTRWGPAGDALAEVAWRFVPEAAIVAAGGAEVASSRTQVLVDDRAAATIPRVRILGEFGIRALF